MDYFYTEEPWMSPLIANLVLSTFYLAIFSLLIYRRFDFDDILFVWTHVFRWNYREPEVQNVRPAHSASGIAGSENAHVPNSQANSPNAMASHLENSSVGSAEIAQLAPPLEIIFDSTPTNMNERIESVTNLVFYPRKNKADKSEMEDCVESVVLFLEGLLKEESFSHLYTEITETIQFISNTWKRLSVDCQDSEFESSVRKGVNYCRWGSTCYGHEVAD